MDGRRVIIGAITGIAVVVFVSVLARAVLYVPQNEEPAPLLAARAPARAALPSELPVRLRIPALSIDAAVQKVGVKDSGAMASPSNFTDVGWYKYGTVPGFEGSAVIDGHVDNGLSLAGVFKNLPSITVGDDIFVDTSTSTLHFVVEEIVSYPYKDVPVDRIFNTRDIARLNLITCEGAWVHDDKTYDHRLVVYAREI